MNNAKSLFLMQFLVFCKQFSEKKIVYRMVGKRDEVDDDDDVNRKMYDN